MIGYLFRKLPQIKGKRRLARLLLSLAKSAKKDIRVLGKFGCTYKLPNILETIGFEIFINGIYEEETIRFISGRLRPSGVLLDIGANIGAISIPVSKLRRDVQILGLEAAPWIFQYLDHNISINQLDGVRTINKAISDSSGELVDFFSPKDKYGKGSLAPIFTNESEKVETITIDELPFLVNQAIDFIKIDVEGFEALAFRGGVELLMSTLAPDILFEFVDWAEELAGEKPGTAQLILTTYGYRLYLFQSGKIGELINLPLVEGSHLIFATKKNLII